MQISLGRKSTRLSSALVGIAVALYLVLALLYMYWGQPNADEGWYLYASKLVFQGRMPYHDFAYTQMPLLPYIYGLPQLFVSPSLFLGRLTSVLFSFTAFVACILIAWKLSGKIGSVVIALLLVTYTEGIYFTTIVKTYGILTFFFVATLYVLVAKIRDSVKFPLAVFFALCAAMVRLSAVFFALAIIVYVLTARSESKLRLITVPALVSLVVGSWIVLFLTPDMEVVLFNLVAFHTNLWGDASALVKLKSILLDRIPSIARHWPLYLVLMFLAGFLRLRHQRIIDDVRKNSGVVAVLVGLALFSSSHLFTGAWHLDYLIPAVIPLILIVGIFFTKLYDQQQQGSLARFLLQGLLLGFLLLVPVAHGMSHINRSGRQSPLAKIADISEFLRQHTQPLDKILVLEALWVAVDSHRDVLPGLTMAQFSYHDLSTEKCRDLHVVNYDILLKYIQDQDAKVLVLTNKDFSRLGASSFYSREPSRGGASLIQVAIDEGYELVRAVSEFGQSNDLVYVYLRRNVEQLQEISHSQEISDEQRLKES